jgi:hypothetical protein
VVLVVEVVNIQIQLHQRHLNQFLDYLLLMEMLLLLPLDMVMVAAALVEEILLLLHQHEEDTVVLDNHSLDSHQPYLLLRYLHQ